MTPRALTFAFGGALAIGAYAAGCGSPDDSLGGYSAYHQNNGSSGSGGSSGGSGSGSGSSSGGNSPSDARTFYIQNVDPVLRPVCGTCHIAGTNGATVWMAQTPDQTYSLILGVQNPLSQLVTKGAHEGPALTAAQAAIVQQWLTLVGMASGGEGGAPKVTLGQALQQFGNCMDLTKFTDRTQYGVSAADIARQQTTKGGTCNACHNTGDGGFWASYGTVQGMDMVQVMFQNTQAYPYDLKWIAGTVDQNDQFKDLVPSNAIVNKGALASQCAQMNNGNPCHPQFQLDPAVVSAINDFVQSTLDKWHNGTCTAAPPPSDGGAD
jgi:hypothetical protein